MSRLWSELREEAKEYYGFWFDEVQPEVYVVGRIGLGLSMFFGYLLYEPYMEEIFGPHGLQSFYSPADHFARTNLWEVWWTLLAAAAAFTIGFGTRLSGAVLLACHLIIIDQTRFFSWGWVPTMPAFLAYYTLAPSNRKYSVDSWIQSKLGWRPPSDRVSISLKRVVQLHVIAVYIGAGWHRIGHRAWERGEMVFDAVSYSYFSRFPDVPWQHFKFALVPANYIVWGLELFAPLGLIYKPTRIWFACGLFGMHLGLELTSTIGWWQFMMMFALFTFFPESWSKNSIEIFVAPRRVSREIWDAARVRVRELFSRSDDTASEADDAAPTSSDS